MHSEEHEILLLEDRINFADSSDGPDTSMILQELLADEVKLIGPDGQFVTKEFVVNAHRPPKKQTFLSVKISDREMKKMGHAYLVICKGEFTTQDQVFALRFSRLWEKEAGHWKVVMGTITMISAS